MEGVEGLRWWFEEGQGPAEGVDLSLGNLLSRWDAIETDFHHFYGCDFGDGVLARRTWRWFRVRMVRLLADDTQLARAVKMPHTQPKTPTGK